MENTKQNNIIEIIDYEGNRYPIGIEIDNVKYIDVTVISGDEIFIVTQHNGSVTRFDAECFSNHYRALDFYDGSYRVEEEKIIEWMGRENTYYWLYWRNDELE